MPIKIVREDITKIKCDCIVNPTNVNMRPSGGVDAAIHKAAGKALRDFGKELGSLSVGEAKITPAFDLPCKYVIHTVGPKWKGGLAGERILLRSCYQESMRLAVENGCESIAFPLISSGLFNYPKDKVLREAENAISEILDAHEMDVFIVVYDKTSYSINSGICQNVQTFVDNFYTKSHIMSIVEANESGGYADCIIAETESISRIERHQASLCVADAAAEPIRKKTSLDDMLSRMDRGFADTLFYYIDQKGITDVEAYKRSNVDKKTFSKIKCNKDYRPSKITAVSFAVGLHLNLSEAKHLLSTAGMCLSRSNKFDVIIEYFLLTGEYDTIFDVNEVLYQFDQSLLGV